jgi:HEPN domain-containing protein
VPDGSGIDGVEMRELNQDEMLARFTQADALVAEAGTALFRADRLLEDVDFHGAIEAVQHSIEFSVKAVLTFTAVEFRREHEVSKQLETASQLIQGLETWERASLARLKWISPMWSWANVGAVYGSIDVPASRLFTAEDTKTAIQYAREAYNTAQTVLSAVRFRNAKLLTG